MNIFTKEFLRLIFISVMTACCVSAAADEFEPLRQMIRNAVATKKNYVKLPPGIYRCKTEQKNPSAHLFLKGIENLEIDATGVEMRCEDYMKPASAVVLRHCKNVKIKGLIIDADPLCFTQGTIVAVDKKKKSIDLKTQSGYPTIAFLSKIKKITRPLNIMNPVTRTWKKGAGDCYIRQLKLLNNGLWRLYASSISNAEIGDLWVLCGHGGCAITARQCKDLTYEAVTIYQSGVLAFHEHGGDGNTHIIGCTVTRRPGTDRLISTNADGFHCKNIRKGPTVINTTFQYMMDDGTNIHGMFGRVAEHKDGAWKLLSRYESTIRPGDTLEFYEHDKLKIVTQAIVKTCERTKYISPKEEKKYFGKFHTNKVAKIITFENSPKLKPGMRYLNLNACGSGFTIRGCLYGPLRYRGLLIRSKNGIIENNKFTGTASGGIHIESDYDNSGEGPYAENVSICGNSFIDIGCIPGWDKGCGIIACNFNWPKPQGPNLEHIHKNLKICNNFFFNTSNDAIHVEHTTNAQIDNNIIVNCGSRNKTSLKPQPIRIKYCTGVTEKNNRISKTK